MEITFQYTEHLAVDWLLVCIVPRSSIHMKHDIQLDSSETSNFRWGFPN
jgi:hypothetical protein